MHVRADVLKVVERTDKCRQALCTESVLERTIFGKSDLVFNSLSHVHIIGPLLAYYVTHVTRYVDLPRNGFYYVHVM